MSGVVRRREPFRVYPVSLIIVESPGGHAGRAEELVALQLERRGHRLISRRAVAPDPSAVCEALNDTAGVPVNLVTLGDGIANGHRVWNAVEAYCGERLPCTSAPPAGCREPGWADPVLCGARREPDRLIFALSSSPVLCRWALDAVVVPQLGRFRHLFAR